MKLTRLLIIVVLLGVMVSASAQNRKKKAPSQDPFLNTQWWLGFRGGTNLTSTSRENLYSSFSPINYESSEIRKTYESYNLPGIQAALEFSFYIKGFYISFQPGYINMRFRYKNEYEWTDQENQTNTLSLSYTHTQNLDYFEFPLIFKYEFTKTKARPFVQLGGYYATLLNAQKKVETTGTDNASGGTNDFENEEFTVGVDDLFLKSSAGILIGGGVNYDPGNVRLIFDINYRYGLHNVTNAQNRFSDNTLTSIGDVFDDISLRNLAFSVGALFPLKFLSKNYQSVR